MKDGLLKLLLPAVCCTLFLCGCARAQVNIELSEIKGESSQIYRELKIEITGIKRLEEYQPLWHDSGRPRGRKIIAESGFEIALVQIKVTRIGENPGISINRLSVYDFRGREYEAQTRAFIIGTGDDSKSDTKETNYEFPTVVARGIRFSTVQLQHFLVKDEQPVIKYQKITFDVSQFNW